METRQRIFISYSRANQNFAIRLAKELKSEGFSAWLDQLDIPLGARWDDEVYKALTQCEIFMLIMTPASVASENVKDEMGYAIDSRKRITPILLEKCEVPFRLRRFQYVDFTNKNFEEGVQSVKELLRNLIAQMNVPGEAAPLEAGAKQGMAQKAEAYRKAKEATYRFAGQKEKEKVTPAGAARVETRAKPLALAPQTRSASKGLMYSIASMIVVVIAMIGVGIAYVVFSFLSKSARPVLPNLETGTGQLIFASYRNGDPEIYTMHSGSSDQIRLTNGASARELAWSPAGNLIAFASSRDGNSEIYTVNSDGSDLNRLTNSAADDIEPAWSPDGKFIAFASYRDGRYEIDVMNADGSNPIRLTNSVKSDDSPAWSPDGRLIAFESYRDGNAEIYTMNIDGSNPIRLTNSAGNDTDPAWSPDGKLIAFESQRDGNAEIYTMNADGTNPIRLTSSAAADTNPAWSPDGKLIAFASYPYDAERYEIDVMNADGSNLIRLIKSPAGVDNNWPDWHR